MSAITQTEKKGPWFVVDMTERWKKRKIKRSDKPTKVYRVLAKAIEEAHRLCIKHPGHHWAVFECIGYMEKPVANAVNP